MAPNGEVSHHLWGIFWRAAEYFNYPSPQKNNEHVPCFCQATSNCNLLQVKFFSTAKGCQAPSSLPVGTIGLFDLVWFFLGLHVYQGPDHVEGCLFQDTLRINKNTPKLHQSCKLEAPKMAPSGKFIRHDTYFFPKKRRNWCIFWLINMQNMTWDTPPKYWHLKGFKSGSLAIWAFPKKKLLKGGWVNWIFPKKTGISNETQLGTFNCYLLDNITWLAGNIQYLKMYISYWKIFFFQMSC